MQQLPGKASFGWICEMVRILDITIIVLIFTAPGFLWAETWEPISLVGQSVLTMTIDPQHPENRYAITGTGPMWMGGSDLLKTTDGGNTWRSILGDFRLPSYIAVNPAEPNKVHVGAQKVIWRGTLGQETTNGAVFNSIDAGETWDEGFARFHDPPVEILQLVVHPADPNMVYVVRRHWDCALHRSENGGKSWEYCSGQVVGPGWLFIQVDPMDPKVVYACGTACCLTVSKSEDKGSSFTGLDFPIDSFLYVQTLAIAPSHPDRIYAMVEISGSEYSLLSSTDAGVTWEVFPTGLESGFRALKVSPVNPNLIYGIGEDSFSIREENQAPSLFVSEDSGRNWQPYMDRMEGVVVLDLTFHPQRPWELYACTSNGIYVMGATIADALPDNVEKTIWGDVRSKP